METTDERLKEINADEEVNILPQGKRGRPCLLGVHLENQLQMYLKIIKDEGGIVNSAVVIAAARGILKVSNPSALSENGGHITLGRS